MKKTLICVNTCSRAHYVMAYIVDYIRYCQRSDACEFILSLDGYDKDTVAFCKKYRIPLLYSEKREGVGISKNRVLNEFEDYDYYFFLDDDSELVDAAVFDKFISISKKCNIHHMSLGEKFRFFGNESYEECGNDRLLLTNFGSGSLSFFTVS